MDEDSNALIQTDDELDDEIEGLGMPFSQFCWWAAGLLFIGGVLLVGWLGPAWYATDRQQAFWDCIEADTEKRQAPPVSCLSVIESASWLAYIPWSDKYMEVRSSALPHAHTSQLRYVSTVAPSARERAEALDALEGIADDFGPIHLALSEPRGSEADQYLTGLGEPLRKSRPRHVDWSLRNWKEAFQFRKALDLAEVTADAQLREWLVDRAVETFGGDAPLECFRCPEVFEMAVAACRIGRRKPGLQLARSYAETDRTEHVESAAG